MTDKTIAPDAFDALVKAHNLRGAGTIHALRLVLVDGMKPATASQLANIDQGAISRALVKVARPCCPTCRRPMPDEPPAPTG